MNSNQQPCTPVQVIQECLGDGSLCVNPMGGDGSDRSYYRISSPGLPGAWVLMQLSGDDQKKLHSDHYSWVHLASFLQGLGIRTPFIKARLPDYGSLILEDCGDQTLETLVTSFVREQKTSQLLHHYEHAFDIIAGFLSAPSSGQQSWYQWAFDEEKLASELRFFREHYLGHTLDYHLTPENQQIFLEETGSLSHFLANRPRFLVHRDFHSRNLMWKEQKLITIDFQDARPGPASYDLVSLCFDPYVPLKNSLRLRLLNRGLSRLRRSLPAETTHQAEITWRAMLIQRTLKAIGSFGFLTSTAKRGNYLSFVPAALEILADFPHPDWPFLSRTLPEIISARLSAAKDVL